MDAYWTLVVVVFVAAYLINISYITVFYHRGLTHQAVKLKPGLQRFVVRTGAWITGLDPKGWCCMHRLHHRYSDTKKDPHSPVHLGFFMIAYAQLLSYKKVLRGLMRRDPHYCKVVEDLKFDVSWSNKKGLWYLPYLLHATIALVLGMNIGAMVGVAYFVGMTSHPVQGWMVNSMGHYLGYRNFNTTDNSKNNTIACLLVAGEGLQNNHHRYPKAAKFSMRWWEVDWGYALCLTMLALGMIEFDPRTSLKEVDEPEAWDLVRNQA